MNASQGRDSNQLSTPARLLCGLAMLVLFSSAFVFGKTMLASVPAKYVDRALKQPNSALVLQNLREDQDKTLLRSGQAISLDPSNPDYLHFRGLMLGRLVAFEAAQNNPEKASKASAEAISALKAALKQRPAFHYSWVELALVLADSGPDAAELSGAIEQAVVTAPYEPRTSPDLIRLGITNWLQLTKGAQQALMGAIETGLTFWPLALVTHAHEHGYKRSACVIVSLYSGKFAQANGYCDAQSAE